MTVGPRSHGRCGVAVAGSISTMQPVFAGDERADHSYRGRSKKRYRAQGGTLAEAGVDVLVMEMIRDTARRFSATEAAMETGLPVSVGLSFEPGPNGGLVGWGTAQRAQWTT